MLIQQTLDTLQGLRLHGMVEAFEHQRSNSSLQELCFDERFSLIVDAERLSRENRRLARLLKNAKLKTNAAPEDIDYRTNRGLDKKLVNGLLNCDWIAKHQHLIITGPTGVGKTWLACALGNQAARKGLPVTYKRFVRLLEEFEIARADGSLPKLRMQIAKSKLLILDDWGLAPLTKISRLDLMELIEDANGSFSVAITAQLPVSAWHDYIGDPAIADAVLDRLVHTAHRIELTGDTLRRTNKKASAPGE